MGCGAARFTASDAELRELCEGIAGSLSAALNLSSLRGNARADELPAVQSRVQ
jgi:hypothetical protein